MFAYLDESGIHKDAEACVVAGFFAKKGPWRRLESMWKSTLRNCGVPLDEFHANALLGKKNFFRDWPQNRRQAVLMSLAQAIADSGICPVSCSMFTSDFYKLSEKERRFVTGATWDGKRFLSTGCPSKPYFVLFTECLKVVTGYIALGQRARFFCGVDRPAAGYAKKVFANYQARHSSERKLGTITFPLASETPPLQAADLFSHLAYQHMLERKDSRDWSSLPSEPIQLMLRNRKMEADTLFRSTEILKEMISVIPNMV